MRILLVGLLLAGCTSSGAVDPNLGARVHADLTCVAALTKAGISLKGTTDASDPTALQVATALDKADAGAVPPEALAACETTLSNAAVGAQGLAARIKAQKAAQQPK